METSSGIKKYPHGKAILKVAGGKELSPHSLLPGDLIFKYTGDQLLHVSIVTSVDAALGAADHAHHLNAADLIGLHVTSVTTASNLVVRCRHEPLRKAAAEFARRWTDLAMPYSNFRRRAGTLHEEKSGEDVVAIHRKLFDEVGKFRAIKFTARRNGDLIYPGETDPRIEGNRGMFCSMFVVVCYHVAGLQDLVDAAPDGMHVSDKSTAKRDILVRFLKSGETYGATEQDRRQFDHYLGRLTEVDPYQLHDFKGPNLVGEAVAKAPALGSTSWFFGASYRPSIAYWRSDRCSIATCNWPQYITKGMMVDAKVIMPLGLLECLLDDQGETGGWEVMGILGSVGAFMRDRTAEDLMRSGQQKKTDARFPTHRT
jgi:hypothetical protein